MALDNVVQLFVPRQPFIAFSLTSIVETRGEYSFGFSIMPGITNGIFDYKLKYTQNTTFNNNVIDRFMIGFEITLHIALQDKHVRKKSLID